ncbi:coiled-coil domain-containing protein 134-like [Periplaneta americana]|uniref:coiled-coil domain-containing protein 134-like n=1 Tax=Periplaneta americana TaxID=6978 RepID=UPI0037E9B760
MLYIFPVVLCCSVVLSSEDAGPDHSSHTVNDPAEKLFIRLFKQRRLDQLEAVKRILALDSYEKQYKMVTLMTEKVFTVIQSSRVTLESSGYIPGSSSFPKDENVLDALSNILENTALFGEVLLRLPDIAHKILKSKYEWDVMLHWSLGFVNQTQLLDKKTYILISLVSQELNITERDPNYVNPYRNTVTQKTVQNLQNTTGKKKRKKERQKGPRMSSGTYAGEL